MFEVSGIGRCERLFGILEENMVQFKQSPLVETSQTPILRMCNDLLKRLSRSAETSFCGRILFFLSRYLPLSEKSGLNLMGHFNTQNVTKFDTSETQPVDLINASDEEMETGEIKETKEVNIPVDHALYSMFWQMQSFFSNPQFVLTSNNGPRSKRRPRIKFDPAEIDIGTPELTKLWSIEPNLLEACKNKRRKFAPSLVDFLRDPIDELDPEQQVEEQYKSTRDPAFQFRACRLLMVESSQYISAQTQQTLSIPQFLDNVILKTGKNMEEFRAELQEREERQARKAVEESLLRNRSNGVEGSASPSPDYEMSDSTLAKLASILAPHWKKLAEAMEMSDKRIQDLKGQTVKMPAFFLSKTKGPPKKKIGVKRGLKDGDDKEARLSRRRRMMERTEISSDDDEVSVASGRISEASEGEYEIEDIARNQS
ncbi:hypothetical protein OSTOST_03549 [Ostertagia ostertagi]